MGYDLHITRRKDWFEEDGPEISLAEWRDYVAQDPELRLDNQAEATTPAGETIRYENEGLAVWTGTTAGGAPEGGVWFDFRRGNIVVKNPENDAVIKMHAIAQALGGRVQGDEGEDYGPDGEPLPAAPPAPEPALEQERKPWWRLW